MNLTEIELEKLKNSKSATEWDSICDAVKQIRGGQYPQDWFAKVVLSGVINNAQNSWLVR